ncbi:MAG: AraC family transcriptional regulator [Gammaproteobacteria bacterium]|nr:AraC family transcriptional regulator [Gammaproteobacteria bacterium]
MADIPLVRARYAHSFAKTLENLGAPTGNLLGAHRLSPDLVENQGGLITAHQLWSFAGSAARREGLAHLGLLAGQLPVVEHGAFGKMVYEGITLYDAIQTFCDNATMEYSRADFYLTRDAEQALFCRGPIDGEDAMQRQQVELYVLVMMIDTIRLGAGSQWQPRTLRLQTGDSAGLADVTLISDADTCFGCSATAIGFPLSLLGKPLKGNIAIFTRPDNISEDITTETDFGESLRRVLKNYHGHTDLSLQNVAEITGLKQRTLQRRLKHAGLTFRDAVDQVRYELSLPLLHNRQHKLLDIALELGYSDAAHFIRAFRRWCGLTPSEFRKQKAG